MSKHLRAFRVGANVIAFQKKNTNYLMTCAWAMMVDYKKIAMLIGSQSITGQNLEVGLKVGVSALAEGQQEIARVIGTTHSNDTNKLENIKYINKDNMLLIADSKVQMECVVEKLVDMDGDLLVFLEVKDFIDNDQLEYLDGYDPKCY